MRIALLAQNQQFFERFMAAIDKEHAVSCKRFPTELSLIGTLSRGDVDVVIVAAQQDFAGCKDFFAWRRCHGLNSVPVVLAVDWLDDDGVTLAFENGVDDLISGNLSPESILGRLRAVLGRKHLGGNSKSVLEFGPFRLDKNLAEIRKEDQQIRLTSREFTITWMLFSNIGTLLTKNELARTVWGKDILVVNRSLEQHIYKVRRKLDLDDPANAVCLMTVYSLGYKLEGRQKYIEHMACDIE